MDVLSKSKGALLGLAVGDALGAPVEFKPRGSFSPVKEFQPTAHFKLPPGYWTDDTSQALCLAASLVQHQAYDSYHVMEEYLAWYNEGKHSSTGQCFDIGIQTRAAFSAFMHHPVVRAGEKRTTSAGNGVIMRLAPAAIFAYGGDPDMADHVFALSAKETHYSHEAELATVIFGRMVLALLHGADKQDVLSVFDTLTDPYGYKQYLLEATDSTVVGDGYVRRSLQAAYHCFASTDTFEACVLKAVNLGDDADTTGAIAGQLAGSYYGIDGIPTRYLAGLHRRSEIEQYAEPLLRIAPRISRSRFETDPEFAVIR